MSVRVISDVLQHSRSKGASRLVLIALADVANDDGDVTAYKRSHSVLAAKANVNAGTVRRAIDDLVSLGELSVLAVGDGRTPSDYRIHIDEGVQDAPPAPASCAPRDGEVHPQGAQDAAPITPSSSVEPPTSPVTSALFADPQPDPQPVETLAASFERFWDVYPFRRGSKADARAAWPKAVAAAGGPEPILAGAARYRADPNLPPEQFVPHAVRWLRGERWNDGPCPPRLAQPGRLLPPMASRDLPERLTL